MEKLMKPAEYAKELGISRQAVYAKIKRGILTAKNVEGKLYIVIDKVEQEGTSESVKETSTLSSTPTDNSADKSILSSSGTNHKALLQAKDETISVLKGTVKDLKKSNKQISSTLKGEIDLLKEAFHEMRSLYVLQLEQKKVFTQEEPIEVMTEENTFDVQEEAQEEEPKNKQKNNTQGQWLGLKKFFKEHKVKKEKQLKIKKRLNKAYKKGDERVMKVKGKIKMNRDKSYKDMVK